MIDRLPPQNKTAETAVLGSILRDDGVLPDVLGLISADSFYFEAHQRVFKAMFSLHDARKPVDTVTVAEELKRLNLLDDLVGYSFIAELFDSTSTPANASYYARIVAEKAALRQLIRVTTTAITDAYDEVMPAAQLLESVERQVLSVTESLATGDPAGLSQILNESYVRIDSKQKGAPIGIPIGYRKIDEALCGLQRGELVIIAARPSVGKTALACNVIRNTCAAGYRVYFASLEQKKIDIADRFICIHSGIDSYKLRRADLTKDDYAKIVDAGAEMSKWNIWIDDTRAQTSIQIAAKARKWHRKNKIDLLVIDYAQFVEPEDPRQPRHEQVAAVSRRFKNLAADLNIPLVLLCQLRRETEDRSDGKPRLRDLKDSGALEQDADVVMMLHRPAGKNDDENQSPVELVQILVEKNRNGPCGDFGLAFRKPLMRFEEIDQRNFGILP